MILSLSPGGGMTPEAAAWAGGVPAASGGHGPPAGTTPVAAPGPQASMYRITGDFHSRPLQWIDGLGEHIFVIGNLSSSATGAGRGTIGMNNTWSVNQYMLLFLFFVFCLIVFPENLLSGRQPATFCVC